MKHVLKSNYSYISSGNYNKQVDYQFYQIFNDTDFISSFAFGSCPDEKVKIEAINEESIDVLYSYIKYSHPNTFCYDSESVTKHYKITKNKKITLESNYMYYNYATGGENGWAELELEWISYDDFLKEVLDEISTGEKKVSSFAHHLIKVGNYDLAFELLSNSKKDQHSYLLALCYEKGYGVEKNIDKAIEIYAHNSAYFPCKEGLERCLKEKEGRDVVVDYCKMMVLAEQFGIDKIVERYVHIPLSKGDNSPEELRRCMSKQVKYVLTNGRRSDNLEEMEKLAKYYDMMNDIPEKNKPVYSKKCYEYNPYEGDDDTYVRYYSELIVATLQKEALKNDVIAIGVLINQFIKDIDNEKDLVNKLTELCESELCNEKDIAAHYLGLYYKREIKDEKKASHYFDLCTSIEKGSD